MRVLASLLIVGLLTATWLAPASAEGVWSGDFGPPPGGSGLDGQVLAASTFQENLVVGGDMFQGGTTPLSHCGMWNGESWTALGAGTDAAISAFCRYDDRLAACGFFTQAGGQTANYVAIWDGSNWSPLGPGFDNYARALCLFEGDLIAGGAFTMADGSPAAYVARWDGSSWSAMGSLGNRVEALAVYDGALHAGGFFQDAGGQQVLRIARWNGAEWEDVGGGISGTGARVRDLRAFRGRLYAAGLFSLAGTEAVANVAVWDGTSWAPLGDGLDGEVWSLGNYGPYLIAGGAFTASGSSPLSRIAMWDGSEWLPMANGLDGTPYALVPLDGGLLVGGTFADAGGEASSCLAQWTDQDAWGVAHRVSIDGMQDYVSVQSALDATAEEGDSVLVSSGAYEESIAASRRYVVLCAAGASAAPALTSGMFKAESTGFDRLHLEGIRFLSDLDIVSYVCTCTVVSCYISGDLRIRADLVSPCPSIVVEHCLVTGQSDLSSFPGGINLIDSEFSGHVQVTADRAPGVSGCTFSSATFYGEQGVDITGSVFTGGSVQVLGPETRGSIWIESSDFANCSISVSGVTADIDNCSFVLSSVDVGSFLNMFVTSNRFSRSSLTAYTVANWPVSWHERGTIQRPRDRLTKSQGHSLPALSREEVRTGLIDYKERYTFCGNPILLEWLDWGICGNTMVDCPSVALSLHHDRALPILVSRNLICRNGTGISAQLDGSEAFFECNNLWGNRDADYVGTPDPTGVDGNLSADPLFCGPLDGDFHIAENSPCAPGNHPDGVDCGLIGALDVACPVGFENSYIVPDGGTIWSGLDLEVPVMIQSYEDLKGYSIHLQFDPAVLELQEILHEGTIGEGAELEASSFTDSSATTGVIYSYACPPSIPAGEGVGLRLRFTVRDGAPEGWTSIDIRDAAPALNRMTDCDGSSIIPTLYDGGFFVRNIRFTRGDVNGDGVMDISDPIFSLAHQFMGGPGPGCAESEDADDSGEVNITDPIRLLGFMFAGGVAPALPFPDCGVDPTGFDLGCDCFQPCGHPCEKGSSEGSLAAVRRDLPCGGSADLTLGGRTTSDTLWAELSLHLTEPLVALELSVAFDTTRVKYIGFSADPGMSGLEFLEAGLVAEGALAPPWQVASELGENGSEPTLERLDDLAGRVRIGLVSDFQLEVAISAGSHRLGRVAFAVVGANPANSGDVSLGDGLGITTGLRQVTVSSGPGVSGVLDEERLEQEEAGSELSLLLGNPYRPGSQIQLAIPSGAGDIRVEIFDAQGRLVRTLHEGPAAPSNLQLVWDGRNETGRDCGSSLYLLRATAGEKTLSRRILLVH